MQLVSQRRRGGGPEHPRLEVLDTALGRLVDHPRCAAALSALTALLRGAHQLLATELIERRVHAGWRECTRPKALL
jgi:hypothetical protein